MEIKLTKENYAEVVEKSDKPVFIDFWATWCGPCQMVGPIVAEIAGERSDIAVCKADVDEQPELAGRYGVELIPTMVVVRSGKVAGKLVGAQSKEAILAMIDEAIA